MKSILKIRIYKVEDKVPKLHPYVNSKMLSSRDLIIYWDWVNSENSTNKPEKARIGWYHKSIESGETHWVVSGVNGNIKIIAWGYLKKLPA